MIDEDYRENPRLDALRETVAEKGSFKCCVPGYQPNEKAGMQKAAAERAFWREEYKRQQRER